MRFNRDNVLKLGQFLSRDGAMTMTRVMVGVVLGAVVGLNAGIPALLAVGLGIVGINAFGHASIEKQKQHELLDIYREEISHITGKDVKSLTVNDLKCASEIPHSGGRGSQALRMALDYFKDTRNFYIGTQAVTAGLVTVGLYAINNNGIMDISALGLAGASALVYDEVFKSVYKIGALFTSSNIKGTITHDIKIITRQIAEGGRISSTRVMSILAKANPPIEAAIMQKYGQKYEDLSIADKRHVVDAYDNRYHVVDLARKINTGKMLPTELAFVVFGEASGTPLRGEVPEMHLVSDKGDPKSWVNRMGPSESKLMPRASSHVAAIEAELVDSPEKAYTIH